MIKLVFFGGSFNPPTYAHLEIAKTVLNKEDLNKFIFVPVGNTYKKPDLIDEKYRYEMLKLLCRNEKKIFADDIELKQKNNISTIEAFTMIESKYKRIYNENIEISYVMGADNFIKLPTWNDAETLIRKYKYIIFKRDNLNLESFIEKNELVTKYKNNFKILEIEKYQENRSSIIRNFVKENRYEEARQYTKPEIVDYINQNGLYQ